MGEAIGTIVSIALHPPLELCVFGFCVNLVKFQVASVRSPDDGPGWGGTPCCSAEGTGNLQLWLEQAAAGACIAFVSHPDAAVHSCSGVLEQVVLHVVTC